MPLKHATSARTPAQEHHMSTEPGVSDGLHVTSKSTPRYDLSYGLFGDRAQRALTLRDAGQALRRLRKRRGWTLDEVAAMAGVAKMSISHLERGNKEPRPSTITKIEAGLGWKPGSFYRLAGVSGDDAALDDLVNSFTADPADPALHELPVRRIKGSEVMTAYVEATADMVDSLIGQLPPPGHPRFSATVTAALTQCAKVSVLTATSWRLAAPTDRETVTRLLATVRELDVKRQALLQRIPDSTAARFDAASRNSALPEAMICVLTGLTTEEAWSIRNGGTIPEGANAKIAAFLKAVESGHI